MNSRELNLSGYSDHRELLAQRYTRAGKSLFVIALPIHLIPSHMPQPDPDEPFEGNRKVNPKRASDFSDYWRQNKKWATPPLLLDTTYPLSADFEVHTTVSGVDFGILRLPHQSESELQILDGQHRILGWSVTAKRVADESRRYRELKLRAEDAGDMAKIVEVDHLLVRLDAERERLRSEYVTVEILEGVTLDDHKQYFHDIATNAKGITKSLTASFDRRKVVNRVSQSLIENHPLLKQNVELESDTVRGRNENWISGKNVTDIVTAVTLGMGRTMTAKREAEADEEAIVRVATAFFDAIVQEFPVLAEIASGDRRPNSLRGNSLLASPTVLRAMAGAYYGIAVDDRSGPPTVTHGGDRRMRKLMKDLALRMPLPIDDGWWATGLFDTRQSEAPGSRTQNLKELAAKFTELSLAPSPSLN
jgi:hypothetical protein